MRHQWLCLLFIGLAACKGCSEGGGNPRPDGGTPEPPDSGWSQPGPDERPADLGPAGFLVQGPTEGAELSGQWTSVSGWLDPKRYAAVLVLGAPVDGFYLPVGGGHGALASVPVTLREDGRFVAPRVPLAEGTTDIHVIGLPRSGEAPEAATQVIRVRSSNVEQPPATLVATPAAGVVPLQVSFTADGESASGTWEWDFEGDGTFNVTSPATEAPVHTYTTPGRRWVIARTRRGTGWTYVSTPIRVSRGTAAWESTARASVTQPRAITVVPDPLKYAQAREPYVRFMGTPQAPTVDLYEAAGGELAFTRYVLVSDGDTVQVFDAALRPLRTLTGLSEPRGLAGDEQGRIYVADTGNDRVVRFTSDGRLDATFAGPEGLRGPEDAPLRRPTGLLLGWSRPRGAPAGAALAPHLFIQEEGGRLVGCEPLAEGGYACAARTLYEPGGESESGPLELVAGLETGRVRAASFETELPPFVATQGGALVHYDVDRVGHELSRNGTQPTSITGLAAMSVASPEGSIWAVTVDAEGWLREWVLGGVPSEPVREHPVPFPLTAIAADPLASAAHASTPGSGPFVLYAAGPGRIERFVLPSHSQE